MKETKDTPSNDNVKKTLQRLEELLRDQEINQSESVTDQEIDELMSRIQTIAEHTEDQQEKDRAEELKFLYDQYLAIKLITLERKLAAISEALRNRMVRFLVREK